MDKFLIKGGNRLTGNLSVSGAKNSALPCLAATLLSSKTITLHNVPHVRDLITQRRLLEDLGAETLLINKNNHKITASEIELFEAPYELVKTMRASILVLGPLLGRFGKAKVSLPGGCAIGTRPIDLHLRAFEKLGAKVSLEAGDVVAKAPKGRLIGTELRFDNVTVTGTENVMMAAVLAKGATTIVNAACEPEIEDLATLLNKMGAKITGAGTSTVNIEGVEELGEAEHSIIPDRIETGTFIIAAAITNGSLAIENCQPKHLETVINKLREVGVEIDEIDEGTIKVRCSGEGLSARDITTKPYPSFPTDMQAQYMTLMTQSEGSAVVTETIFENRFMHVAELYRMGASIEVEGNRATVIGKTQLTGARVLASDLRASASLLLAGLAAEGETLIDRVYHIDRGYEKIVKKIKLIGGDIKRIKEDILLAEEVENPENQYEKRQATAGN